MDKLFGTMLIVAGLCGLAWAGINPTAEEKTLDIGPIHASGDETLTLPLLPIAGGLAVVVGVALVVAGRKRSLLPG